VRDSGDAHKPEEGKSSKERVVAIDSNKTLYAKNCQTTYQEESGQANAGDYHTWEKEKKGHKR